MQPRIRYEIEDIYPDLSKEANPSLAVVLPFFYSVWGRENY